MHTQDQNIPSILSSKSVQPHNRIGGNIENKQLRNSVVSDYPNISIEANLAFEYKQNKIRNLFEMKYKKNISTLRRRNPRK